MFRGLGLGKQGTCIKGKKLLQNSYHRRKSKSQFSSLVAFYITNFSDGLVLLEEKTSIHHQIYCIVLNQTTNVLLLFVDNYIAKIHYCSFNVISSQSQGESLIRIQDSWCCLKYHNRVNDKVLRSIFHISKKID